MFIMRFSDDYSWVKCEMKFAVMLNLCAVWRGRAVSL